MISPLARTALAVVLIPFLVKGPQLFGIGELLIKLAISAIGGGVGFLVSVTRHSSEVCNSAKDRERVAYLAAISGVALAVVFVGNLLYFELSGGIGAFDPYIYYASVFLISAFSSNLDRYLGVLGSYDRFLTKLRKRKN